MDTARSGLLDLPAEVLSQIATFLPLRECLTFLTLNSSLFSILRSPLTPLPGLIAPLLHSSEPYPPLLAKLPSLSLFLPDDTGWLFLEVLVYARPKWILERLEYGRWGEDVWREAYRRRFLPSWERYRGDGDSWRAVFLRMLSRLEHRYLGCTHEESWTRFVTLHRNGSTSLNRIYSRLFDPYDIYEELKQQNNFAAHPTQVRVLLHLQDIRILAVGVLISQPSLFTNPNAHLLLHPPLMRGISLPSYSAAVPPPIDIPKVSFAAQDRPPRSPAASPSAATNEAYFPLVRTLSLTGYGSGESSSPGFRSTLAKVLPGRARRGDDGEAGPSRLGGMLTASRSRDSADEGRRRWSFVRTRSGSAPIIQNDPSPTMPATGVVVPDHVMPALAEAPASTPPQLRRQATHPPTPPQTPPPRRKLVPYPPMSHPAPARRFALYPNFTPGGHDSDEAATKRDLRAEHEEVEDDLDGRVWGGESVWSGDGRKMAEWDEAEGVRKRWVGPMILVAQLHPCRREEPQPPGVPLDVPVEGPHVDLGPKGMYVSLGFEDLEAMAPWLEFRGGGGNSSEPMRRGLGFE